MIMGKMSMQPLLIFESDPTLSCETFRWSWLKLPSTRKLGLSLRVIYFIAGQDKVDAISKVISQKSWLPAEMEGAAIAQ